jgi:AcrR family transcriptional regulator
LAKIDLGRRAEIGRQRRANTRAQLIAAARFLFTSRSIASVTVEDVTRQARLSKGAFYSHFRRLDHLWAAVAAELAAAFEEVVDAKRPDVADPVEGTALGCAAFIGEAQRDPTWGALIARGAWVFPAVATAVRERLHRNLRLAQRQGRLAFFAGGRLRSRLRHRSPDHALGKRRDCRLVTWRTSFKGFCARSASRRRKRIVRCGA